MNPEGNRHNDLYGLNSRPSDSRFPPTYPPMPQHPLPNLCNYLMPMHPMMYPPYSYPGITCSNNPYYGQMGNWRDSMVGHPNFGMEMNSLRNFYSQQNMRVIPREVRERGQTNVIVLQSDDEQQKQRNVPMPPTNITNKQNEKQATIINLDQNSEEKNQKVEQQVVPPKSEIIHKKAGLEVALQRIEANQKRKQRQKDLNNDKQKEREKQKQRNKESHKEGHSDRKTKQIVKAAKYKEIKVAEKDDKNDRYEKQRRRKIAENQRIQAKLEKEKEIEKRRNERSERAERAERLEKNAQRLEKERNQKIQKNEKVVQKIQKNKKSHQSKGKTQDVHTKQIAKYMESHGEIRHGKQFQSDIPTIRITENLDFNKWLDEKRKKLLLREVGVLTY